MKLINFTRNIKKILRNSEISVYHLIEKYAKAVMTLSAGIPGYYNVIGCGLYYKWKKWIFVQTIQLY